MKPFKENKVEKSLRFERNTVSALFLSMLGQNRLDGCIETRLHSPTLNCKAIERKGSGTGPISSRKDEHIKL